MSKESFIAIASVVAVLAVVYLKLVAPHAQSSKPIQDLDEANEQIQPKAAETRLSTADDSAPPESDNVRKENRETQLAPDPSLQSDDEEYPTVFDTTTLAELAQTLSGDANELVLKGDDIPLHLQIMHAGRDEQVFADKLEGPDLASHFAKIANLSPAGGVLFADAVRKNYSSDQERMDGVRKEICSDQKDWSKSDEVLEYRIFEFEKEKDLIIQRQLTDLAAAMSREDWKNLVSFARKRARGTMMIQGNISTLTERGLLDAGDYVSKLCESYQPA
jgi:hypothetical protein